jgi:hypothetical protein
MWVRDNRGNRKRARNNNQQLHMAAVTRGRKNTK